MAIKKISEFDLVTELAADSLAVISWDNGTSLETRKAKLQDVQTAGTKTLKAFISQTGTNAPVLTGTYDSYADPSFTPNYIGVGEYSLDGFAGALGTSTHIRINTNALSYGQHIKTEVTGGDQLKIYTYNNAGALTNAIMDIDGLFIEVITYL